MAVFLTRSVSFLFILAFAVVTHGQGTGGSIRGTVKDVTGAAIGGATVTVESKPGTAGYSATKVTDATGFYIFTELPPGSYSIKVQAPNFRKVSDNFEVFVDDIRLFDVYLSVGAADVIVDIVPIRSAGATPEIRTNFGARELSKLPTRTTAGSTIKFAPFARPEPLVAGYQLDGSSGGDNTYFIDGQEVTNFRTGLFGQNYDLPLESVAQFQIRTSGRGAEYSGATGGTLNLVTKGGGNVWRGEFGFSFTPSALQGGPNTILSRYGANAGEFEYFKPNKDGGAGYFPTASLSGPILKDKLWFFASYAPQIADVSRKVDYYSSANPSTRMLTESIRYKANTRGEQALVRLDAQPTSRLRLFGTYLYNPIIQDGGLPSAAEGLGGVPQQVLGLRGADYFATRGGRLHAQLVTGQASIDVTRNFLLKIRAGYGFLNEKLDSYGIPKITRFLCSAGGTPPADSNCTAGFQNVANNSVRDFDVSKRSTFGVEGQVNGIELLGRHNFRFGYDFNRVRNEITDGYIDTGLVQLFYGRSIDTIIPGIAIQPTPGNLGSGLLQRSGTSGKAAGRNQALFIQDSWTIAHRLTVNIGLRLENERLPHYGDPEYPSGTVLVGEEFDLEWNWKEKAAPRVAGVYDLFGDGRSKAFAGFGFYYDRMKFEALRSKYATFFRRDYFEILPSRGAAYLNYTYGNILGAGAATETACPITNSSGWSVCRIGPLITSNLPVITPIGPDIDSNLLPSRVREFTAGFEQRLPGDTILTGRYIFRDLDRAIEDIGTFNSQGSQIYTITNPGSELICSAAAQTNFPCPKAQRRYDAVEFIFDKRSTGYFFNANYTYSRLYGNYSGLSNSDEGARTAPNVGRFFDLPSAGFTADGAPDNGRLATDRPHVFKAYGGYSFRWSAANSTSVSAFTAIASGTPLTTTYSLYGVANSILFGRGDLGRTEMFSETDVRVGHIYKFGKDGRFSIEPYVTILNLFDERNELTRQTQISATNFTSTALTQGGCTTCSNEVVVLATVFSGGISRFVTNYLSARGVSSTGQRNDYNLANSFQNPRSVRLGIRFGF